MNLHTAQPLHHQTAFARKHFVMAALLIALAIFLQYSPALHFGFLGWDDTAYIQEDAVVSRGLGAQSLRYAFTTFENPYFMPLTRLSYMADVSLFGLKDATGYRLLNMVLHTGNSLMLFWLVYRVSRRFWAALVAGLVMGLHPQNVEAVVWIAGRKELLAGFFGLLSLCCYQHFSTCRKQHWYLLALLAFSASLFSKPIWITLPVLLLLLDFFALHNFNRERFIEAAVEKVPFLILSVAFTILFTLSIQIVSTPVSYFPDAPWSVRWMLPFIATGQYLLNTFMPINLVPYYPFPDAVNPVTGSFWVMLIAGTLFGFWRLRKLYPGLLMGALWFGIAFIPALKITVLPVGEAIYIADRYAYLPHIGLFTGLILSLDSWLKKRSRPFLPGMAVCLLLAGLAYASQLTITQWQTPEKLWLFTLEKTTGKGQAYVAGLLGSYYDSQQRYSEAILAYQKAHDIYPQSFIYPLMVGSLFTRAFGQHEESRVWFDKVLDESPAPSKILFDYGKNEFKNSRTARAEQFLTKAIERNRAEYNRQEKRITNPQEIYLLLGLAQIKNQHIQQAIDSLTLARLSPQDKAGLCQQLLSSMATHTVTSTAMPSPDSGAALLQAYCQPVDAVR